MILLINITKMDNKKLDKQQRKDLVYGAKSHIKSILIGLNKFAKGSKVEGEYIDEHFTRLENYYIDKIINYKTPQF